MDQSTLQRLVDDADDTWPDASTHEETSTQELVIRLLEQWAQVQWHGTMPFVHNFFRRAGQSTHPEDFLVADPEAPPVPDLVAPVPAPPSPAPGKHCVVGGTLLAAPGKHAVSVGDKMAATLLSAEVAARAVSAVDEAVETVRTLPGN
jgi:hypothetical protein